MRQSKLFFLNWIPQFIRVLTVILYPSFPFITTKFYAVINGTPNFECNSVFDILIDLLLELGLEWLEPLYARTSRLPWLDPRLLIYMSG